MEATALEQDPALPDPLRQRLGAMGEEIGLLAKDVHQLSRELHPSILDDLGLTAALRAECGAFSRQYGIPVRFESAAIPEGLSPAVSLGLYRIAQESLRNVGKHARATAVRVTLAATEGAAKGDGAADAIHLVIEDNGSGFDLEQIKGRRGLGLVSMEERVRLAEGQLAIRSRHGAGTTVEVSIPVRRSAP
jgi:signal transduction histidine kinase